MFSKQKIMTRKQNSPLVNSRLSYYWWKFTIGRLRFSIFLCANLQLQAIQAKMGSAGDEFTPLSQLEYGMDKCKVRVRISRLWESFNPKNDTLFGLDCLLIDDQVLHSLP